MKPSDFSLPVSAIFSHVHNRGVPPAGFISILVDTIRTLPDEVFADRPPGRYEPDIFDFVKPKVGYWADPAMRRAVMCEVLRVLGGFESSWDWNEGRDYSNPESNRPETTEAGIFQCSANSVNFDPSLVRCFDRYARPIGLESWADMRKSGMQFQWMTKEIAAYAIEHCARLLRFTIRHHGPILRNEISPWLRDDSVHQFHALLNQTTIMNKNDTQIAASPKRISYVIDPGHGGGDSGAVSSVDGKNYQEKHIVLRVSFALSSLLDRDGRFITGMTRHGDTFHSLSARAQLANARKAKLISIHANAGGGTGFECFTTPGQTSSDSLATALLDEYGAEFADFTLRSDMSDGDPDKEARFTVLTNTAGPAVLFELGFMDRPEDLRRMTGVDFVDRAAQALYRGVLTYEGLPALPANTETAKPEPPSSGLVDSAPVDAGYQRAIDELEKLAQMNQGWRTIPINHPDFWIIQRGFITGTLGALHLRTLV